MLAIILFLAVTVVSRLIFENSLELAYKPIVELGPG